MTNKEAIEILEELPDRIVSMLMPLDIDFDYKQALTLAIKALEDVERLEEENHSNFVNSQHIISILVEEIKKLRGEEE